jgi:hypothetical protein
VKLGPAVVALLVLLPSVSATWDQYRGGPGRESVANVPHGALDVLAVSHLFLPSERFLSVLWSAPFVAETREGLVTLVTTGTNNDCVLLRVSDITTAAATRVPLPG